MPTEDAEAEIGECIGRGSLTGRWEPRPGACPNIRGGITLERALPARPLRRHQGVRNEIIRRFLTKVDTCPPVPRRQSMGSHLTQTPSPDIL